MTPGRNERTKIRIAAVAIFLSMALSAPPGALAKDEDPAHVTHDGLVLVQDRNVAAAYVDPEADLSVYTKIMILDCYVAFKKDWVKDKKQSGSRLRISSSDVERIKADVASLFRDVFTETLAADGGYEIVNEAGNDVLLVRPAIIDLDIAAPDTGSAGRNRTYTTSSGAATLYIELFDSVSGDILARASDRKVDRSNVHMSYANRVTNRADARRGFRSWAILLRGRLDELHGK